LDLPVGDTLKTLKGDIKGLKVGVMKELLGEGVEEDVRNSINNSIEILKKLGAEIKEISMPSLKYSIGIYYIIATAEASSNLARFDGVKYGYRTQNAKNLLEMYTKTRAEGFGDEVKRRIMLGTYALSSGYYDAYYKKAQQMRRLTKNEFDAALKEVDILISPTCPTTAFDLGSRNENPLAMYLTDISTICANLTGMPALSTPIGKDKNNMPIGLQIIGNVLKEDLILKVAYNLERELA
jgi:aspartyl-tRNA(Asn)/glutamyl-tRNA(Gln) amidotransferase subunit A